MGEEIEKESAEIEETSPLLTTDSATVSGGSPSTERRTVRTKVPEVEVQLFRRGNGPIAVFKSTLGGWDQDQLEVRDILHQYGFKSIYAFNPNGPGRTVPIRFHPRNGRSMLPYKDGTVIYIDGEPKDSLIKPITKIVVGVAAITILIALVVTEAPEWAAKFNMKVKRIPPWVLACAVIVFTRMRKRTTNFFKKCGWC